jgi:hypothetical protein
MRYSTSYADPRLELREHLPFCYSKFVIYLYSQLQCLRMCPRQRVTEKRHLFHTNRRSGRDRGSNHGPPASQAAAQAAQPSSTTPSQAPRCPRWNTQGYIKDTPFPHYMNHLNPGRLNSSPWSYRLSYTLRLNINRFCLVLRNARSRFNISISAHDHPDLLSQLL